MASSKSLLRQLKDLRYRLFYGAVLRGGYPLMELGNRQTECHWVFCPEGLNERSVVYSGGVGRDITFEHGLVERFGCSVVLLDPSPTGLETMRQPENQIPQFKFQPVGLAGKPGQLSLAAPRNAEEGSWFAANGADARIEVPCLDLSTLLQQNGHDHIDLLKIDIEGAEYEVLDDLVQKRLPVRQVLVEFHHGMLPGIRRSQSIRAILKMLGAGYRLLKQEGNNHTFLRVSGTKS
jgi:FkbM family methyltransferase